MAPPGRERRQMFAAMKRFVASLGDGLARLFRLTAIAASMGWLGFLVGIIATETTDNNVPAAVLGRLFAATIVAFLVAAFVAAFWFRWHGGVFALCVLSAVIPFSTLLALRWLLRSERLVIRPRSAGDSAEESAGDSPG